MTRIRISLALGGLLLACVALPGGPARAQDGDPPRQGGVAPPSSQTPATPPLRDPTRAPAWRRVVGAQSGVTLPDLRLRGRVVSRRGAVALLEIDQQLHVVRLGDQLTLRLNRSAVRSAPARGRRGARPATPATRGTQTLTIRVRKLDANVLELEFVELSQTLTLR